MSEQYGSINTNINVKATKLQNNTISLGIFTQPSSPEKKENEKLMHDCNISLEFFTQPSLFETAGEKANARL